MPIPRSYSKASTTTVKSVVKGMKARKRYIRKKTNKRNTRNLTIVRAGMGFPKKMVMTHRYATTSLATSTTGVPFVNNWSCNGLFDPNVTGGGHQPIYFDQMSAVYDHYTVIGSKITIKLIPKTASTVPIQAVLFINDDTTLTPATEDAIFEQSSGRSVIIPVGANTPFYLRAKWSAKKWFGGSILGNDNLQGTSAANPTEQSNFSLSLVALDGTTTVDVYYQLLIQYIAVWDELKDIASS